MEAVGTEVIIALLPLFALFSIVVYYNWHSIVVNINILRGRDEYAAP